MTEASNFANTLDSSVIIPFFNGSGTIHAALSSISKQHLKPSEVVIVDDASAASEISRLRTILETFSDLDCRVISLPNNLGQAAARNRGVKASHGKILFFLDQDDYWLAGHVKNLTEILVRGTDVAIAATSRKTTFLGRPAMFDITRDIAVDFFSNRGLRTKQNLNIVSSALAISRECFLKVGLFQEALRGMEDEFIIRKCHFDGRKIAFSSEVTAVWVEGARTSSTSWEMVQSRTTFMGLQAELLSTGDPVETKLLKLAYKRFLPHVLLDLTTSFGGYKEWAARERDMLLNLLFSNKREPGFLLRSALRLANRLNDLTSTTCKLRIRSVLYSLVRSAETLIGILGSRLGSKPPAH